MFIHELFLGRGIPCCCPETDEQCNLILLLCWQTTLLHRRLAMSSLILICCETTNSLTTAWDCCCLVLPSTCRIIINLHPHGVKQQCCKYGNLLHCFTLTKLHTRKSTLPMARSNGYDKKFGARTFLQDLTRYLTYRRWILIEGQVPYHAWRRVSGGFRTKYAVVIFVLLRLVAIVHRSINVSKVSHLFFSMDYIVSYK